MSGEVTINKIYLLTLLLLAWEGILYYMHLM